jgi:hypothetical protein
MNTVDPYPAALHGYAMSGENNLFENKKCLQNKSREGDKRVPSRESIYRQMNLKSSTRRALRVLRVACKDFGLFVARLVQERRKYNVI